MRRRQERRDATRRGEIAGRTNASQGSSMTDVERGERERGRVVRVPSVLSHPSPRHTLLMRSRSNGSPLVRMS